MSGTKEILKKIGLSGTESDLYLALLSTGPLRASELMKAVKGKRPTVYYALRQLKERGLVHEVPAVGVSAFKAEPPERLLTMLSLRQKDLESLAEDITHALPSFVTTGRAHEGIPAVSFHEGEHAMQQAIMETLYCASRHIDILTPHDNFFWQAGQTFAQSYINQRVSRKIKTRNLWERPLTPEIMSKSYKGVSEVRLLPKTMHGQFRTMIFLYDDKVMYISSLSSGYILLVQSKEHHEMMKTIYEMLWAVSEKVK